MQNAWRVFRRDVGRLARVRKAWIILIGMMITPSLYAWLNIAGFWDPYSRTQNIDIAVANLDRGASSELTGDIDVGGRIVDALRENDQLGWRFVGRDEAMESVHSGTSFAAFVIPPDFSESLTGIASGETDGPELEYYVNEKINAVSPKITDVGATTLERQINDEFVSVVSRTVADELRSTGTDARRRLHNAQGETIDSLSEATAGVGSARQSLARLRESLTGAQDRVESAKGTLGKVDGTLGEVRSAVDQAQDIADEAQGELLAVADSVTGAYTSGATLIAEASARLGGSVTEISSGVRQASAGVDSGLADTEALVRSRSQALTELRSLRDGVGAGSDVGRRLDGVIGALEARLADDGTVLSELRRLDGDIAATTSALERSANAVDSAVRQASASTGSLRGTVDQTVPQLNRGMSTLSASAGGLKAGLDAQRTQLAQAQNLLTGLGEQLRATTSALDAFDGNLAGAQSGLDEVRTDVTALGTAHVWNQLRTVTGLHPDEIGEFLASPIEVRDHPVYPVASYGSAMAPLFVNLALWIAGFVLVVLLKLEVDIEGVERVTARQAYVGRWLLLAVINVVQSLIVTIGSLAIGVQTADAVAFVGTGVLLGLAYLSIIYALAVTFGFVGKGLAVLLVIMQIPGASGLYPIEVMPGFFHALYRVLPFTYGIDAIRETIAGFYGGRLLQCLLVLAVYVAAAFALGLILRPLLGNVILLFNRRLAETGVFVSEDVQIAAGRQRLTRLVDALVAHDEYRHRIARRRECLTRRYPTLLRLTALAAVAGIGVIALLGLWSPLGKSSVLGLSVLWALLVAAVLVALDYARWSVERATEVGHMSEAALHRALAQARAHDDRANEPAEAEPEERGLRGGDR